MSERDKKGMAPNFKSQLEQARSIANPHVAVAEFTDNSGDANATKIKITSSVSSATRFDLYVSDNGCGMNYNKLCSSLRLGSSQKEEDSHKLFGCKGVGMNLAATYLAEDALEIYSKSKDCLSINFGSIDLKKMRENPLSNDWDSLYDFKTMELSEITDVKVLNFLESVDSGTVVVLRNMSKRRCGSKKRFDKLITTSDRGLSRIYRHILQDRNLELFYNSSMIKSTGPGFDLKEKYQDKIFFEEKYKDGWIPKTVSPWGTQTFHFRYRFVRVATGQSKGTSGQSGGLSIMRNGREVTSQLLSNIRPKDFGLGNLIIELDAPAKFLDNVLTFNGDKQVRTLENATDFFDFSGYFKKEFSIYWDLIKEVNIADALGDGSDKEQASAWKYNEQLLVDRFYQSHKEGLRAFHTEAEINNKLLKEYQIPGSSFKIDLVVNSLPFEFKVDGKDPSRYVGQILSYAPYLIEDKKFKFVKDGVLRIKLALGKRPTNSLIRHVEKVNSSYKIGDVKLNIEIFDMTKECPRLLEYPTSRKEKNKMKKVA